MPFSLQANLTFAAAAVARVRDRFPLGAPNKPADVARYKLQRDRMGWAEWLGDLVSGPPAPTERNLEHQRQRSARAQDPTLDSVCRDAEIAEAAGMGNCGEQAASAFRYLFSVQHYSPVCYLRLGANHSFVVLGVTEQMVRDGLPYHTDHAPAWPPEAVICDPWWQRTHYPVASEWTTQVIETLKRTEPGRYRDGAGGEVDVGLICAFE